MSTTSTDKALICIIHWKIPSQQIAKIARLLVCQRAQTTKRKYNSAVSAVKQDFEVLLGGGGGGGGGSRGGGGGGC
jgi:uncharacterized membrane protein